MKRTFSILIVATAASQLGATDCGNALKDPGFDLWCGGALCDWKVERGNVMRVPTWNAGDSGVSLVGQDVAIEQLSPVASTDGTCLEFDLIANVDDHADVQLNVDVFGDGSVEYSVRIPTSNWKPLSYQLSIHPPFAGIRFELAKTGDGTATLANIGAQVTTGCDGLVPIVGAPAPLGAPCSAGTDCTSGMCDVGGVPPPFGDDNTPVCVACDTAHACAAGMTCAADVPTSPTRAVPTTCVADGSHVLGDQCSDDAECASGICTYNACSTCSTGIPCATDVVCGPAWPTPFGVFSPYLCAPGAHAGGHGDPCATDDDCASATCSGLPRSQCADGRSCASDLDCPFDGLANGSCTLVGVQGGSCQ